MISGIGFKDADRLNDRNYDVLKAYARYHSSNSGADTTQVSAAEVDSMLAASRDIVREAHRENSRMRIALRQKENEIIQNDLTISAQLEEIITNFDAEINALRAAEQEKREASQARTKKILQFGGIAGIVIVLLFSYLILTDFFKAEKLK